MTKICKYRLEYAITPRHRKQAAKFIGRLMCESEIPLHKRHSVVTAIADDPGLAKKRLAIGAVAYMYTGGSSYIDLYALAVHPKYRRQGIATRLVNRVIDIAEEANCESVRAVVCEGEDLYLKVLSACGFAVSKVMPQSCPHGDAMLDTFELTYRR